MALNVPDDLPGLLRDYANRLRRLEGRDWSPAGGWVLDEAPDGALVARHGPSGRVVVVVPAPPAAAPVPGEQSGQSGQTG